MALSNKLFMTPDPGWVCAISWFMGSFSSCRLRPWRSSGSFLTRAHPLELLPIAQGAKI